MLQRRVELDEQLGLAGASKRWDPWVQGIVGAAQPISPPQKIQLPRASQVDRPRTQVLDPPKKTPPQTRIHDPEKAQPTPAELEAESVALALKLQQVAPCIACFLADCIACSRFDPNPLLLRRKSELILCAQLA